jgi:hypothetical protein
MKYSVNVGVYLSVGVSASLEEKEASVLALALTLALFQPSFATDFAKASSGKEGFGGHSTRNGQKLQPVLATSYIKNLLIGFHFPLHTKGTRTFLTIHGKFIIKASRSLPSRL